MKTIIFLTIITLLAFLIAKTFPLGVEASLPPQKSPTVYGLIYRESIAATMVWRYLRVSRKARFILKGIERKTEAVNHCLC